MFPSNFYRNSFVLISNTVKRLENGKLLLEEILDEDELVLEVKMNPQSQLASL